VVSASNSAPAARTPRLLKNNHTGDSIFGTLVEEAPKWSYKPGYSADNVQSSMHAGKIWNMNYKRQ
jgi:hypothetical protein